MVSAPADAIQLAAGPGTEESLFRDPVVKPRPRTQSFLLSAAGHCAFFFLLPQLASIQLFTKEPPIKLYVARLQSLNLRITEPIYAPPPPPPVRKTSAAEGAEARKSTGTKVIESPSPETEAGNTAAEPAPPKPAVVTRRFELPAPVRPAVESQPIVLQPPDPTVGVPVQQLPKVMAW